MLARPSGRVGFTAWAVVLVLVFGIGLFGLTTLVIGWFESLEGVAGPVTDLGYGALVGILLTLGLLAQLRAPEQKIAAMQQAVLVIPALLIGSAVAGDAQNLIPALILVPLLGILLALHPARAEFLKRGTSVSPVLLYRRHRRRDSADRVRTAHGRRGPGVNGPSAPRPTPVHDGRDGDRHPPYRPARRAQDAGVEDSGLECGLGRPRIRARVHGLP